MKEIITAEEIKKRIQEREKEEGKKEDKEDKEKKKGNGEDRIREQEEKDRIKKEAIEKIYQDEFNKLMESVKIGEDGSISCEGKDCTDINNNKIPFIESRSYGGILQCPVCKKTIDSDDLEKINLDDRKKIKKRYPIFENI